MRINNFIIMARFAFVVIVFFNSCKQHSEKLPVKVILDTDFGDDGDDLLALAMLHYMQDLGECEIVAVGQANSNRESPGAIDVINSYYGRPDIPIGIVKTPLHGHANQYSSFLIENYPELWDIELDNVPDAVDVYRRVLANAKDTSIVFVVVGFKKNMSDLLNSQPDYISPLSGIELVKKKVKFVSDMAGWYPEAPDPDSYTPYNFGMIQGAAKHYVENCPSPIIFTGIATGQIELAKKARYLNTPVGRAIDYKLSHDGGWGKRIEDYQAAFDCVSALIAVRGANDYFNVKHGCNKLDSAGFNVFNYEQNCGHSHVDCKNRKMSFEDIAEVIEQMLITKPINSELNANNRN